MAVISKQNLKDVFAGLSSVLYGSTVVDLSGASITISPEYDLPVTVDTLNISQDEPTINHYKIVGLNVDWVSTATEGDMNLQMTIPTNHTDILKMVYGEDAVAAVTGVTIDGTAYEGNTVVLKKKKITGTFVLLNDSKDKALVITGAALWATPLYENASTDPVAIRLTGTIESDGSSPSFAFLKKTETTENP